jgi:hypothetical protein
VVVDGHAAYAGAPGDLDHRRPGSSDGLVQLDEGVDDPLPGLFVEARALALFVPAWHFNWQYAKRKCTSSDVGLDSGGSGSRLTDTVEIGPVSGGIRLDNYFDGHMTDGTRSEIAGTELGAGLGRPSAQ